MGRQKREGLADRRTVLHRSANEAAALLLSNLMAVSKASQVFLRQSDLELAKQAWNSSDYYFKRSIELAEVGAKLAQALSTLKGESHQRISVERIAPRAINAPAVSPQPGAKDLDKNE